MLLQTELVQAPSAWLEITKAGLPAMLMAVGCIALWRAWESERAARKLDNDNSDLEIKRLNEERQKDLREMLRPRG